MNHSSPIQFNPTNPMPSTPIQTKENLHNTSTTIAATKSPHQFRELRKGYAKESTKCIHQNNHTSQQQHIWQRGETNKVSNSHKRRTTYQTMMIIFPFQLITIMIIIVIIIISTAKWMDQDFLDDAVKRLWNSCTEYEECGWEPFDTLGELSWLQGSQNKIPYRNNELSNKKISVCILKVRWKSGIFQLRS